LLQDQPTMKFFLWLASLSEAKITLNVETLTDFNTAFQISGTNIPISQMEKVSFSADAKVSMDLFKGQFSMTDSGESKISVDCKTSRYAKYSPICRNAVYKSLVGMAKQGGGHVFIDATTGKFGIKGHETGTPTGGANIQGSFCAVVNVPIKSYPSPSILKSKLNAGVFKRVEDRLNSMPHTENGGIATFHSPPAYGKAHGYDYSDKSFQISAEGGAPHKAEITGYAPAHQPYSRGWEGASETFHVVGSASMTFSEWTTPATALATFAGCPGGSTTNLHAHPEAKRSLASLNVVVQMLRQHDDLGWLPEDPAAYFMEQLEQQDQEQDEQKLNAEPAQTQSSPLISSLLAGVSGGGIVLALFNLAKKKQHQVPLLSEA